MKFNADCSIGVNVQSGNVENWNKRKTNKTV